MMRNIEFHGQYLTAIKSLILIKLLRGQKRQVFMRGGQIHALKYGCSHILA